MVSVPVCSSEGGVVSVPVCPSEGVVVSVPDVWWIWALSALLWTQPLRHSAFDIFIRMYFLILGTSSIRTFLTESFETHKNLVLYYWFQTVWPGVLWVPTYHALHFGKAALPADVDEPRCNDDHAHWADDHQHDKQFAVIAACLAGPGVTRAHTGEVLNADLKCDFH